ncbi:MAG: double-strand break repair helicase AddA [Hyphomonadaceae bacterium]|nr:double-strand break repair helicase AddA [Hyphomonadaceae bacterium]
MTTDALHEANVNQRIAADPANSVFVTANAGSGKTKVLVDRIARLLLAGSTPCAFLCITYTKAAAAEMQRRLFERLGGWSVASDAALAADLEKLDVRATDLGRARALFARALEAPGGLKIQTIHAFCERLLARFPLEAGVPPGFTIADDTAASALLATARAEAAHASDAPREAFARFAARLSGEDLQGFLDRLALRRADFRRFASAHQGELFAAQALRDRHEARLTATDFARAFVVAQDWPALREAARALSGSTNNDQKTAARLRAIMESLDRMEPAGAVLQRCFDFAFSSSDTPYKNIITAGFATKNPALARLVQALADRCVGAREQLNAIERAEDAVAALVLGMRLDQAYEAAKQRTATLDFDDLIEHAQALLQRSDAAPWVLYKLDGGLDHILVDEGQDTSATQWDLLAPLQAEFFAGAGARTRVRTVFAVGDPKQSIYAFQGADPRRFLAEKRRLAQDAHNAGLVFKGPELRTSFRSAPQILAAVDATFVDKPLIANMPEGQDVIEHLTARREACGVVEVWPIASRDEPAQPSAWDAPLDNETGTSVHAVLARALALRIKDMIAGKEAVHDQHGLRPIRAGDVLALVRKRGPLFRELIKAFKRAELPVAGADRMVLREELAVEDCLALVRVALDPTDDLALACVLKGPWCNLIDDDADLFPLAYRREKGETLFARLQAQTDPKYASARDFARALAMRRGDDPFTFLSWALERPFESGDSGWRRVFARLGLEARDPLEELLQRAARPMGDRAQTLQRFLYDIEVDAGQVKRELEAETGAIRVMTVHGAKGLEAPLVILADTTAGVDVDPENGLMFDGSSSPFVSFRRKDDDAKVADARASHAQRQLGEHWRLLYVAMTRARDRLIVCGAKYGNAKAGEAPESWRLAVHEALGRIDAKPFESPFGEGLRLGEPQIAATPAIETDTAAPLPEWARRPVAASSTRHAAPSRALSAAPPALSPLKEGRARFRRGLLIHGLLQRLPGVPHARRMKSALAFLAKQGVADDTAAALAQEALAVVGDARFAPLFSSDSRAEAPIIGLVGDRKVAGIVDRLVIERDRVMILDFKTDRPAPAEAGNVSPAYVLQLALYRNVLQQVFPKRDVVCALLWTEAPRLMDIPEQLLDAELHRFLNS